MSFRYALIDRMRGTRVLEHYRWLASFRGNGAELARLQEDRLRALLNVLRANPFYSPWMAGVSDHELRESPRAVLSRFPVLTKQAAAQSPSLFQPQPGRKTQSKQTGGSTGEPFRYVLDMEAISLAWAYIFRSWTEYAGYRPGDPYVTVAGTSLAASGRSARLRVYHELLNSHVIPADTIRPGLPVNAAALKRAVLLYGYPSALCALLECVPDLPAMFRRLGAVVTTSEQLSPHARRHLEQAFQVKVYDQYGANDGGLISCETARFDGYHYHPLNCLVENWRNEDGEQELLLTSLNCWTFPLVRYRVGDLGRAEQPGEAEGVVFPRIVELRGRTRDLLYLPSGRKVHGSAVNASFYPIGGLARYRIVQSADYSILLEVSCREAKEWDAVAAASVRALEAVLGEPLKVEASRWTVRHGRSGKEKLIESHVRASS